MLAVGMDVIYTTQAMLRCLIKKQNRVTSKWKVLPEKLIVAHLLMKFPPHSYNNVFIILLTRAHCILTQDSWTQSKRANLISVTYFNIVLQCIIIIIFCAVSVIGRLAVGTAH
jgi:hypothetical protein